MSVSVTDQAWQRLSQTLKENQMLRVSVLGGGCSGFQYHFELTEEQDTGDLVLQHETSRILVDEVSLPLLDGSVLDWQDELIGSRFAITNPNAVSGCGCGTSFNLKM